MSKQVVCHITTVHKEDDVRILRKECTSLYNNGYEVVLLVPGISNKIVDGVVIHGLGKLPSDRLKRVVAGNRAALRVALGLKADLFHIHDPELLFLAWRLSVKGKKVIYDAHEDLPRQVMSKHYIPASFRKMVSTVVEKAENWFVRRVSGVVAATPVIEARFKKVNKRTISVCNYPSLTEFSSEPDWSFRREEVCYVGGIFDVRGARQMVDLLPHTSVRLILAGAYSPKQLRGTLSERQGWSKVEEAGFVDRIGVKSILGRSLAGLLLLHPLQSYRESLPVKMFEYMAAGIPVIASDFPLWRQILGESGCGICCNPFDLSAVAEIINKLHSDQSLARGMGMNGRKAVKEKYNWEQEEAGLVNFYHKLLTGETGT